MGNVKSVSKNFKNFRFFDENLSESFLWQKISQHAAQLKSASSIDAKTLAFPSFLYRQVLKIYSLLVKSPKICIFIAINSPKKNRQLKTSNMVDHEPVAKLIQKSDKPDQKVSRKIYLKRWNAEGCHGPEKNWNDLDVSLCE